MNPIEALKMHGVGVGKKLVGDAQSGDVRAGKTFSNAQGNDKQGTMPVRSLIAQTITPGVNNIIKQAGIYDGDITIQGDVNLVGANILPGKSIFGVSGSASVKRVANGTITGSGQKQVTGLAFTPTIVFLYTRTTDGSYETQVIFGDANQSSIKTDTSKVITSINMLDTADATNIPSTTSVININGTAEYDFNQSLFARNDRVTSGGFDVYCQLNTNHYWVAYE